MFYVSKVSLPFFFLAMLDLLYSLAVKSLQLDPKIVWITAVFGFVAHTIMSAMYQIVPNSQGRPLRPIWLSYVVFALSLFSSFLFYLFQTLYASLVYAFASLLFAINILLSIKNWQPITVKFIGLGTLYLLFASFFLLLSELGFLPLALAVHSLTLGFMLNVVVGVELAWIPMLYMEPLNIVLSRRLFYLSLLYLPPFLLSLYLLNYRLISLASLLVLAFVGYFFYILYSVFSRRRMPKEVPLVVRYFILALIMLPFGLLLGSIMAGEGIVSFLLPLHFDLLVYGFTGTTIMGGLAHLYPRIVYNWKFSGATGVSLSDLLREDALKRIIFLIPLSLAWMLFADAYGGFLSYMSSLPYILLWLYFAWAVLLRGMFYKPTN
ncbi:hypothetical protein [Pampinifervens florentissimum]|uniref:hypothetical protein n=1 Tax=Pampinifervens florentissimum TaxID=1632019 RepID=UPI0013B48F4C|nr:hypothetical protein [Hydrogenobacter sp. T-8]QID32853.1 hypothetical protein G3M65_03305 [Hydrogenobacter sp. T-8]